MFQFVGFASCLAGWHASSVPGFPIRAPADHRPFAPPRGFSQPAAPFLASGSLGILRAPCGTCRAPRPSRRLTARDPRVSSLSLGYSLPNFGRESNCLVCLSFHPVKEPSPSTGAGPCGEQGIRTLDPRLAEPMLWPAELAPQKGPLKPRPHTVESGTCS